MNNFNLYRFRLAIALVFYVSGLFLTTYLSIEKQPIAIGMWFCLFLGLLIGLAVDPFLRDIREESKNIAPNREDTTDA